MSESSANRFMRVGNVYDGKSVTVTDLTATALYDLAAPVNSSICDQVEGKI